MVHGRPLSKDDIFSLRQLLGLNTSKFEIVTNYLEYFRNTINERMYEKFNIAPTNELLQSIKYDSKYFSKLLSGSDNFTKNFNEF